MVCFQLVMVYLVIWLFSFIFKKGEKNKGIEKVLQKVSSKLEEITNRLYF